MSIDITQKNILDFFKKLLSDNIVEHDNHFIFNFSHRELSYNFMLEKEKLEEIVLKLRRMSKKDQTILYDANSCEVLVHEESRNFMLMLMRRRNEGLSFEDSDNGIKYELSTPSPEYLVFIIMQLETLQLSDHFYRPSMPSSQLQRYLEREDQEEISIFDFLSFYIFRFQTLKIRSSIDRKIEQLTDLATSFCFHLSYNVNLTIIIQRSLDDYKRVGTISRFRRRRIDDLDPPRRLYQNNLVYSYQMAVSAESPLLEFLSYYHIAENFFESVFEDSLVENVRTRLTAPDFSYRRKKDIKALIKEITKALKFRDDNIIFNEQEALRLTLEKFVEIETLVTKLKEYDEKLLDYYKTHRVSFSGGCSVNFDSCQDDNLIYKELSTRIYKTRNALVHSKESEKSRYTPYYDDSELIQELPLLRFIAEEIILTNSSFIS